MKKLSMNEMMGKAGGEEKEDLDLDDLQELLGNRMPELSFTPVGRMRLITALRSRFGENYRQLKGISKIIKQFDEEMEFNVKLQKLKLIKGKKNG